MLCVSAIRVFKFQPDSTNRATPLCVICMFYHSGSLSGSNRIQHLGQSHCFAHLDSHSGSNRILHLDGPPLGAFCLFCHPGFHPSSLLVFTLGTLQRATPTKCVLCVLPSGFPFRSNRIQHIGRSRYASFPCCHPSYYCVLPSELPFGFQTSSIRTVMFVLRVLPSGFPFGFQPNTPLGEFVKVPYHKCVFRIWPTRLEFRCRGSLLLITTYSSTSCRGSHEAD